MALKGKASKCIFDGLVQSQNKLQVQKHISPNNIQHTSVGLDAVVWLGLFMKLRVVVYLRGIEKVNISRVVGAEVNGANLFILPRSSI